MDVQKTLFSSRNSWFVGRGSPYMIVSKDQIDVRLHKDHPSRKLAVCLMLPKALVPC